LAINNFFSIAIPNLAAVNSVKTPVQCAGVKLIAGLAVGVSLDGIWLPHLNILALFVIFSTFTNG